MTKALAKAFAPMLTVNSAAPGVILNPAAAARENICHPLGDLRRSWKLLAPCVELARAFPELPDVE